MGALPSVHGRKRPADKGATLIELLAGLLVVAILTALLLPNITQMKGAAESAKCVSNLRQIGMGISEYVADHDGYLPGPLSGALHAYYTADDTLNPAKGGRLACYLQGYVSPAISTGGGYFRSDVFVCPSFARAVKKVDQNSLPYVKNGVSIVGGAIYPFGNINTETPPQRLAALGGVFGKPLSGLWMIQDLDGDSKTTGSYTAGPDSHTPRYYPDHPVHPAYKEYEASDKSALMKANPRGYRNALFFDFHVARVNLAGDPM